MPSRLLFIVFFLSGISFQAQAQQSAVPDSVRLKMKSAPPAIRSRAWWSTGFHAGAYTTTLLILDKTWYRNYPRIALHSFDDSREWLQVDKIGHSWSSFGLSRSSHASWKWAGFSEPQSAILGSVSGFTFLTLIEFLDGQSAKWGWSWSDVAANTLGTGLFLSQQLAWQEQRIQLKFSFHRMSYAEPALHQRANQLFGSSWSERMLKDYNGQTYWLSINPSSFIKKSNLPRWLNLAVGYGADGMFGGFENVSREENGVVTFNRSDIRRVRQFYLSPDIDFTRIPTRKKGWRTLLFILNGFKLPAPALMLDSRGRWKGYLLYF